MGATGNRRFDYTADRGPFRVLVAAIAVVLVIEAPVVFLLLGLVLPASAALPIEGVLTLGGAVALCVAASPLFTAHRVEEGVLRVRYGLLARADVPVGAISASPVAGERPGTWLRLVPRRRGERARVTFSDAGLVRVRLAAPVTVRVGPRRSQVRELLLNVDEPDALLEALSRAGAARAGRRSSGNPRPPGR
jgi:hypothetical protein